MHFLLLLAQNRPTELQVCPHPQTLQVVVFVAKTQVDWQSARLNSCYDDRILCTRVFFKRLQARGYKSDQIKSLFYKAISRAEQYSGPTNSTRNDHTSVIFHLPFHPNDPPSYKIQQAWRDTIASPRYHMSLPNMCVFVCVYLYIFKRYVIRATHLIHVFL